LPWKLAQEHLAKTAAGSQAALPNGAGHRDGYPPNRNSHSNPMPAPGSAPLQHISPIGGAHATAEAVDAVTAPLFGLVGSLGHE